jgi:hypothetical protein
VAAFRLRRRGILWSLLAVFLVGLGMTLNAWLSPQPRCVIPFKDAPSSGFGYPRQYIDFVSDDGGTICTCLQYRKYSGPMETWDTHSGQMLGPGKPFNSDSSEQPREATIIRVWIKTTKDGRFRSICKLANQEPGLFPKLFGAWWPWRGNLNDMTVTVSETATGRIVSQLKGPYGYGYLSNDGRTMVTEYWDPDGSYSLRCWDLPLRPPLRLVIGIPLGIGLFFVLVSWWRGRRRAAAGGEAENQSFHRLAPNHLRSCCEILRIR